MRTTSTQLMVLLLLSTLSVSLGCGDDEDEARPRYNSGVTTTGASGAGGSTIVVSDLGEDDKSQLCASLDAFVQANLDFDAIAYTACLPAAIVLGGSEQGCEMHLQNCMSVFPPPIMIQAQLQDEEICFRDLDQCNATVAALETCVNVHFDSIWDVLGWSCAGANSTSTRQAAERAMDTLNVCADLNAACNNFAVVGPD